MYVQDVVDGGGTMLWSIYRMFQMKGASHHIVYLPSKSQWWLMSSENGLIVEGKCKFSFYAILANARKVIHVIVFMTFAKHSPTKIPESILSSNIWLSTRDVCMLAMVVVTLILTLEELPLQIVGRINVISTSATVLIMPNMCTISCLFYFRRVPCLIFDHEDLEYPQLDFCGWHETILFTR